MITISGQNVTRESGAPTLYDIGYHLSKQPRFGGATTIDWTVLDHLYACALYAKRRGYSRKVQLYAALHDAHEAITSDIPQPWKTDDMREIQRQLDVRIYGSLGLRLPDMETQRLLHFIDNQMVYAEAKHVAPQVAEAILKPGPNFRDSINPQDWDADVAVQELLDYECGTADHRGKMYEVIIHELMKEEE